MEMSLMGLGLGAVVGRQVASRWAGARLQQGFAVTSGAVAMLLLARGLGWIVI